MDNRLNGWSSIIAPKETNYRQQIFDSIKMQRRIIILYGAGEIAERVASIMKKEAVMIDYQMVDEEYESISNYAFTPMKIDTLRSLSSEEVVIIAGMRDYLHVRDVAIEYGISNVVFLDRVYNTEDIDRSFFIEHEEEFYSLYKSLDDDLSRKTMIAYLKTNLDHDPKYLFDLWDRGDQYFSLERLRIGEDEVFVNCGSYTGDTIVSFLKRTQNRFKKIYAFEADKENFRILDQNINGDRIVKINKGVYSDDNGLGFVSFSENDDNKGTSGMSYAVKEGEQYTYRIDTCRIDDVVREEMITMINMDIEGSELQALQGAINTLKRSVPKMAISVYHKKSDLLLIPAFISNIDKNYRFALRAYCPWAEELCLYAYH